MPEWFSITDLFVPVLIIGVGSLVFVSMMLVAMVQWKKVAEARRWPVSRGRVLESRVTDSSDSDGGTTYRAEVTYEYAVGGQMYRNDLLAFGSRSLSEGGSWGEKKAHRIAQKYFVGKDVGVHYDPTQPGNSVLEVRSAITKLLVFIGVIFLITSVGIAAIVVIVD